MPTPTLRSLALALPAALAALVPITARAQHAPHGPAASTPAAELRSTDGTLTLAPAFPEALQALEPWVRPQEYRALFIDDARLAQRLALAPLEETPEALRPLVIELPTPDGTFERFAVVEAPIMEAPLQNRFPEIRTYLAQGLDDPHATARLDRTPAGFHAQVLSPRGAWYIDPFARGNTALATVYWKRDLRRAHRFVCGVDGATPLNDAPTTEPLAERAGPTRRTYRLAVGATGEYTTFHGGTVVGGLAAVVTAVNRVSGVYEADLAVRLTLVANNDLLIFTNAATDPYTSPGNGTSTFPQHQTLCDTTIGAANYDVGHVFHRAPNNGVAGAIGNVCVAGQKARGYSATDPPVGDPFSVDYVAHELGHQFGGRHTFNNCGGGPGDSAGIAHEPGSGSTIMAYAGICGSNDLQPNSDAMFASVNFDQMIAYVSTGAGAPCAQTFASGNTPPTVSAGPNFTIPSRTPFALTATGIDPDGDPLTYSWEQRDGGAAVPLPLTDNGSSPICRAFPPSTSPTRTVPRLSNLLNNTFAVGEILPTTNRTLNWRVTARDNRAGNGGVNTDDAQITVVATAGPFRVTSPNTHVSWTGVQTVTWDVAGTASATINCAQVRITLSTDGGQSFPIVLAESVPNTGSAQVTLPPMQSTQARIKVEAVGNIFFDISNTNFTLTGTPPGVALGSTGAVTTADPRGPNSNNASGFVDAGESAIEVTIPVVNAGLTAATGIVANLVSLTPTASVLPAAAARAYPAIAFNQTATNAAPFVLSVAPNHPCGTPIALRLDFATDQGNFTANAAVPTGRPNAGIGPQQSFTYAGAPVAISDFPSVGARVLFPVAGVNGPVRDVDFRFTGSQCTNAAGATTVGLEHSAMGNLVITLTSPGGTAVTLADRNGFKGNNLCNTLFDDDGGFPLFSTITAAGAPWSGNFAPIAPLSALDGQTANGQWLLSVDDTAAGDTGNVRAFTLLVRGSTVGCDPPRNPSPADFNNDGTVNPDDLADFIAAFFASPPDPRADFNATGTTDPDDLADYIAAYFNP